MYDSDGALGARWENPMFWKIVGMVALVWVGLVVIGALFDHLFGILVLSAIIFGGYLLYKAMSGSDKRDHVTRL